MPRLLLLLVAACAVQVLSIPRLKTAENGANAVTATSSPAAAPGPANGARNASSAAPAPPAARRNYEAKPEPKDLAKKKGKNRSTSSSSGANDDNKSGKASKDSLDMTDPSESSSSDGKKKKKTEKKNKHVPKSTEERHGWRKWHRKCTKCPEDQKKKWRDPRIKWICGGYQRARRSFKSLCLMRYRNCQDGTMFVFIHEHRCANSSPADPQPRGEHFMYDYKVLLSDDSSDSKSSDSSSVSSSKSSS